MRTKERIGSIIDKESVIESLAKLHKKTKAVTCWECGDNIKFQPDENGKWSAHNPDDTPHWKTCPYNPYVHRKQGVPILKKLALVLLSKFKLDLEKDFNLDKRELQVIHSILEKEMELANKYELPVVGKVSGDIPFTPEPCDSIGDPDEERAPSEDLVIKVQEEFHQEHELDKLGVTQAITEMIKDGSNI